MGLPGAGASPAGRSVTVPRISGTAIVLKRILLRRAPLVLRHGEQGLLRPAVHAVEFGAPRYEHGIRVLAHGVRT